MPNPKGYTLNDQALRDLRRMTAWWRRTVGAGGGGGGPKFPPLPQQIIIGKLNSSLSQGSFTTASIWNGTPNSESDSDVDVTVHDWLMTSGATAIASGKKVVCTRINGAWYVTEAECP